MRIRQATLLLCTFAALAIVVPGAKATEANRRTVVTFDEPVEVPGVVLEPGAYTFKLLDQDLDRDVVQIFDKNEGHLYATVLAIPEDRLKPTDNTVITFEHRAPEAPEAIRAWFYPGSEKGLVFVYPKERARQLAKLNHGDVMSMSSDMQKYITTPAKSAKDPHVKAMKKAHVTAMSQSGVEREVKTTRAASSARQ